MQKGVIVALQDLANPTVKIHEGIERPPRLSRYFELNYVVQANKVTTPESNTFHNVAPQLSKILLFSSPQCDI